MVNSLLNPDKILGRRNSSSSTMDFSNFMLGKDPDNSFDSITSAANNIIKFSSPNVRVQPPDISNLIVNISKNVVEKSNSILNNSIVKNTDNLNNRINQLKVEFNAKLNYISDNLLKVIENKFSKLDKTSGTEDNSASKLTMSSIAVNLENKLLAKIIELQDKINSLQQDTYKSNIDLENDINLQYKDLDSKFKEVSTFVQNTNVSNTSNIKNEVENLVTQINEIKELNTNTIQSNKIENKTSFTQLDEIVVNVQEKANQKLDSTIVKFTEDYQQKIKGIEDSRPSNVLSKFLDLYQNAIGFVTFFGNRKNIDPIEKNLKALRNLFEESFDVAKVLRQTIIKIVNQLSNLPTASANSSGLNLDIDVPGGRLKQAGGSRVRNVARGAGPGAAVGIGMMGLGSAAELATSGMQRAKQYQEELLSPGVQPAQVEQSIPEGFIDSLSSIVDRFTSAIDGLIKSAGSSQSGGGGGGGGGGTSPSSGDGGGGGGGGVNAGDIVADTPEEKAFIATVREAEGTAGAQGYNTVYGGAVVPQLTEMTLKELYDASKLGGTNRLPQRLGGGVIPYKKDKHNSSASGAPQLMPYTLKSLVESGKFSWDQKFSPETQNSIILALARQGGVNIENIDANQLRKANNIWAGLGPAHSQTTRTIAQSLQMYRENLKEAKGKSPATTTNLSEVSAAPTRMQSIQQRSQAISQPVKPQVSVTSISLPPEVMDASPPQQSSSGGNMISTPAQQGGGTIEVPMFSSSNPDNFLTMYSRIVYNIVDG